MAPAWSESEIRSNLQFLHTDEVRGRADASIGYSIAAAYVAERLREYRLQPALESGFRVLHHSARNVVSGARIRYASGDTLDFIPGLDFLPDGRSAPYDGSIEAFWMNDVDGASSEPNSVLLWAGPLRPSTEASILSSSIRVLLRQGSLSPRPSARQWENLTTVDITSRAARRLLAETRREEGRPTRRHLDRPLGMTVASSWSASAAGINVIGFVPGKDPEHASESVVLCTHLDAVGLFSGVPVLDTRNFGTEVAAVLEAARQLSRFSRYSGIPERSLIVAFVSGGTVDSSGLTSLLRSPLWAEDMIRRVVYVGKPGSGIPSEFADRLEVLSVPDRLALPDTLVLNPDLTDASRIRLRTTEPADAGDYMDMAVVAARELAERIYVRLAGHLMSLPGSASTDAVSARD
jgi:hypothetical protein